MPTRTRAKALPILLSKMANAAPPPKLKVSEWADRYRQLSRESSAEPGRWSTARAEYQRGIMDALTEPGVERVVIMSSAQVGKTEILNNLVGYHIDQDPAPILVLQPTIDMAQAWSKDRLSPMMRDSKRLSDTFEQSNRRSSANTLLHKTFDGGHITMAGANSPASLASRPIRVLLCDEVDRYPVSAGSEGDPVNLATKRTNNFWNRRIVLFSTPTVKGTSRIEMAYLSTDQRRFFVPCPDCGEEQFLQWSQVEWIKDDAGNADPESARYCCENCGSLWSDAQRYNAITKGEWIATEEFNGRAGFHLNELYSPWVKLSEIVENFLEAKDNPETLQTWVNTSLGETWEDEGETVENTGLMVRREEYAAPVPAGAVVLTCAVDVQGDRLEYEVVGWGPGDETFGIENNIIPGDPSLPHVWRDLDDIIDKTWTHEHGHEMQISATGIDTGGHHTQIVYDYCRQRSSRRVFALKGVSGSGRQVVQRSARGRGKNRRVVDLYTVGVDDAKGTIFARLRVPEPGPGYCHFPIDYTEEYFLQLTAEKQVTKYVKGFPRKEWIKTRARNEALDLRVYNYATKTILNPVYSKLAQRLKPAEKVEQTVAPVPPRTTQRARPQRRRKTWATDI